MDTLIKKKISINSDASTETKDNQVLNKLDILLLNNGWNDKNEKLIVDIGYNCGIYRQLHEESARYHKRLNKGLNLSLVIFNVFLTTDSIISLLKEDLLLIFQKIIIFIVTILSLLINFLKYGELSEQHIQSSKSFNVIYNDIRNMMCIYRKDRMNAIKYIQATLKAYDHLEISSPEIPTKFLKKVELKLKTDDKFKNIHMPNGQLKEIEVMTDKNDENNELESNISTTLSNKFKINNMQNIQQIHECFKINGELSENDNITISDLENYRKKGIDLQTQYEFNRFMRH